MSTKKQSKQSLNNQQRELTNLVEKFNQITESLNLAKSENPKRESEQLSKLIELICRAKKLGFVNFRKFTQQIDFGDHLYSYLKNRKLPAHSFLETILNGEKLINSSLDDSLEGILDQYFDEYRANRLSQSRNTTQLVYDDFRNLLLGHFYDNVHFINPNEMIHDSVDISIIKAINESFAFLKSLTDKNRIHIRGDGFALFKDVDGFGINMLLLPKNYERPFSNQFSMSLKDLLDEKFETTFYQDPRRVRYTLRFNSETSKELLKREIPNFGIEVMNEYGFDPSSPVTLWFDSNKQFDKHGKYAVI